ncbi:hypothetical protein BH11VER1_BH11VER1_35380 [soil metagenome]
MADKENKNPLSVSGSFYVDDSCTDCDLCRSLAEFTFIRDDEVGMSYVHRQPVSADELALAEEAMNGCPSQSIGNDG